MNTTLLIATGTAVAVSMTSALADGLAEDFGIGNPTGVRTDREFNTNGPYYEDKDPGNAGDKEGHPVALPGIYVRGIGWIAFDSNPWEDDDGHEHEAWVTGMAVRGATLWSDAGLRGYLAAGLEYRHYEFDGESPNRDGSDDNIFDLALRAGLTWDAGESARATVFSRYNYGGTGAAGLGYVQQGIQDQNIQRLESQIRWDYRFDHQPLGNNGWEYSTGLEQLGFWGDEFDYGDLSRLALVQTATYNVRPGLQVGGLVRVGCNGYGWYEEYDSESLDVALVVDGILSRRFDYRIETGLQNRTYDDRMIHDRDEFYFIGVLNGEVSNNFFITAKLSNSIEDVYGNFGAQFFEPQVFRAEVRGTYDLGDVELRGQLGASRWDADLTNSDDEITRYTAGVGLDKIFGANRIGLSLEHNFGERDFGGGVDFDYDRTRVMFSAQHTF